MIRLVQVVVLLEDIALQVHFKSIAWDMVVFMVVVDVLLVWATISAARALVSKYT